MSTEKAIDRPIGVVTGPCQRLDRQDPARVLQLQRLWEAADPAEEMARWAPCARVMLTGAQHGRLDAALLDQYPKLELIASFGVGYDHIDAKAAAARGVIVTHTPDVLTEEVADTAFGLLLNAVRRLHEADAYLRAGHWPKAPFPLTASLRGRKMGVLGMGRIGLAIARRAEAFGLEVAYHNRRPVECPYAYFARAIDLARACDVLVSVLPSGPATQRMIGAEIFEALGPDGVFINIGRGATVDEAALIHALQNRIILSAGLDVFENEPHVPEALRDMPHVALSPHVGSATHKTRGAMAQLVADNVLSFLAGRGPLTPVPETPWPQTAQRRPS